MNGLIQLEKMLAKKRPYCAKDTLQAIEAGIAQMRNQEVCQRG